MKKILGLDLGSTSIGWALVHEANDDHDEQESQIIQTGVRIVSLTGDEKSEFDNGKTISTNSNRTLKRGARRGLQRFKQRRNALIEVFSKNNFVSKQLVYAENGKHTTFSSYKLRDKAAQEQVSKEELVQVLLMINKKRGYKSSRKAKSADETGQEIDGMAIVEQLKLNNLSVGQWMYEFLKNSGKNKPDFYKSDLESEIRKIIKFQKPFYPDQINPNLLDDVIGKSEKQIYTHFDKTLKITIAEKPKGKDAKDAELLAYKLRAQALETKIDISEIAFCILDISKQIGKASSYLGDISDRSRKLMVNKQTVGQYLYKQLVEDAHARLKNQVFYRQDYMNEFEQIWCTQAAFYPELNDKLKHEVRDITIFYQRRLKSQKHLVGYCEFEKYHKTVPKSSPLFQEFRMWQNINSIAITSKENIKYGKNAQSSIDFGDDVSVFEFDQDDKTRLAQLLNYKGKLEDSAFFEFFGLNKKEYHLNYENKNIEGNRTNAAFYKAFEAILIDEGHDDLDLDKQEPEQIERIIKSGFESLGINTDILAFDATLDGNAFDKQAYYQFWHLLYSGEENEKIGEKLCSKFGFKKEHNRYLLNIELQAEYGSLSAKAIKKILPHLKDGLMYSEACLLAGYNHSSSLTSEENETRILKPKLELLKKNSLRNPVVEKVLNQMINVVNAILEDPEMGQIDEIRIELARELRANNAQREKTTKHIKAATKAHEEIRCILSSEFAIKRVTKNDIIRYKLWQETEGISLYTGKSIEASKLFSADYDIEHIIPISRLYDDSFANKTLCERNINLEKGNITALSYLQQSLNPSAFAQYKDRVNGLFKDKKISYTKHAKLLMADKDIPEDFISRQLNETQYITKKAMEILRLVVRNVSATTGTITDRLRNDWELVDVMKELNWDKYEKLGLTKEEEGKKGERLYKIMDWTKRNDHRHHAMDALTVAFTKQAYIQYLNTLNAKMSGDPTKSGVVRGIETKYLTKEKDGKNKFRFNMPIKNFRQLAKTHLEGILISHKAKNKVVTKNKNIIKTKDSEHPHVTIQLTPRGPLHKETVYGKINRYASKEEKPNAKFTSEYIGKVANKQIREALLARLAAHNNDAKKAFTGSNSLDKKPIYLDDKQTSWVPDKVKIVWQEEIYTKKATIDDKMDEKTIEKVIDEKTKERLKDRLAKYKGNAKEAFGNLAENPIWQNEEKKIAIKTVTISAVSNVVALHTKKDHFGNQILDSEGQPIQTDFVSSGNNHHVAIYRDHEGKLQEEVISLHKAVARKNNGLDIINKNHEAGWTFMFTMKKDEFFIFPSDNFDPNAIDLFDAKNNALISPNLFRVQEIATKNYLFKHHLETTSDEKKELKGIAFNRIQSTIRLENIVKVRINHLGKITKIGE